MTTTEMQNVNEKRLGKEIFFEQTQEECAELIKAIAKYKRTIGIGQKTKKTMQEAIDDLALEIADVEICIQALKHFLNLTDKVEKKKEKQIEKVYNRGL